MPEASPPSPNSSISYVFSSESASGGAGTAHGLGHEIRNSFSDVTDNDQERRNQQKPTATVQMATVIPDRTIFFMLEQSEPLSGSNRETSHSGIVHAVKGGG